MIKWDKKYTSDNREMHFETVIGLNQFCCIHVYLVF